MMRLIAISQRVAVTPPFSERRDCLDQAWIKFLTTCGLTPLPVPNDEQATRRLCNALPISGILLTGGNDLSAYGGDAPERDATESLLIDIADQKALPILGVCRGMQMIQNHFGIQLERVAGHVTARQLITIEGEPAEVNSYHDFGATETQLPLKAWAVADDGVVEAVRHASKLMMGIMWHPERLMPFASRDISLFRQFFRSA
jgi:N5-(cytidine 5'-diphosphoramidyl)-L-glutamine hydrolase